MDSSFLFYTIIGILVVQYLMDTILDYLNTKHFLKQIPEELQDIFDAEDYQKAQEYHRENYRLGLLKDGISLVLVLLFLIFGGFGIVDNFVREYTDNGILQALGFFGILALGSSIVSIPLSYYQTFFIEEKYGFNKTTKATFHLDILKSGLLSVLMGGGLLALVIWFLEWAGANFWLYIWFIAIVFMVSLNLFYSKLLVPLFNKQTPLEAGDLKMAIENYAKKVGFDLKNIFVIDGSKRSTKANAYFSGFGKQKRVTLYDTLIKDLDEEEIVAVLAHEVGHYKRKHIVFNMLASIALTGIMLYILSLFINYPQLSLSIGVQEESYHAGLLAFFLLYSPISIVTGLLMNHLSRKFEFQADDYAKNTFASNPLISSLKKLSKNNLSNLTPHPAYVFVHYSHPPLIERIKNLKA
ncbi:M48 family metallopeptidase [Flavobacteriaceae bacterium GF1]